MKRRNASTNNVRRSAIFFMILRGPIIFWACFAALVYRSLRLASVEVQFLCSLLLGGCILTISDWVSLTTRKLESIKKFVQSCEEKIVVDRALRAIFSIEHGWLGCVIGGLGLYNLPFTPHQKTRILQLVLPKNIPVLKAFYQPGGIRYFYPDSQLDVEHVKEDSPYDLSLSEHERQTAASNQASLHDLLLDELDNSHVQLNPIQEEASTLLDRGDDCSTPTFTASTIHLSPSHELPSRTDISLNTPSTWVSLTQRSMFSDPSTERNLQDETTWTWIIKDFLRTNLKSCLAQVDEASVRNVGIVATLLFLLQMKTSTSSRRIFVKTLQGLTSFGLVGAASGCMSLWMGRRYFLHDVKEREPERSGQNHSILSSFYIVKKYIEEKVKSDLSWVKWKRVLAAVVFLYIGKMRRNFLQDRGVRTRR